MYKNRISGIYTVYCKIKNLYYVGYSVNVLGRLNTHRSSLKLGYHKNPILQNHYNKYGEENFEFELLDECDENLLISNEHYWVTILNSRDPKYGYNIKPTNPYYVVNTREIYHTRIVSEETKRKISNTLKGRKNINHSNFMRINNHRAVKIKSNSIDIVFNTIKEASDYYNVDPKTLRKRIKNGEFSKI